MQVQAMLVSLCLAGVLGAGLAGCGSPSRPPLLAANDPSLNAVSWLAGTWGSEEGQSRSEEHWTQPSGGTMIGMNRTIRDGRTVFFEYLRIERGPDGIVYLASPKGRHPPMPFKLVKSDQNMAVFENPEHDFPQRVIYRREGDVMHARAEGLQRGSPAAEEWVWRRVK
ncbi:MAG: DUF6265 family protein [Phycisphaerales bacterium]|nr:DUF6265 family protein [Phycisphaerales bacterium]